MKRVLLGLLPIMILSSVLVAQDVTLFRTFSGHTDWVRAVAFSPDGKILASGSNDKTIKLWDPITGTVLRTLSGHTGRVSSVAFSPDGKILASGSDDKTIKLWDVATGAVLRTLSMELVWSVAFSPDGKTLASGLGDQTIKLWDVATGTLLRTLSGHRHPVYSVAFSPDGKTLASGSADQKIKLWDVATGTLLRTISGHRHSVYSVAFSPDGKTLASGSDDKTVKLWDVATGALLHSLTEHTDWVRSVAFSPDGKTLAAGSADKTVRLWDVATGTVLRSFSGHTNWVRSVAFSPDGKTLASGSDDKTIKLWKLWDPATGTLIHSLSGHTYSVLSVAFSSDGKILASGSADGAIKLWDVATGKELRTLSGHTVQVRSVAFSPDGKTLASGSADKTIKLWDAATRKELRTLSGHTDWVCSVAFSPDGKILASGSRDKTVRLWDVATGTLIRFLFWLSWHTDWVLSVAFSPDGKTLASGSADKTIKLWDHAAGTLLHTLSGHRHSVSSVAFSPDGKTLASGSYREIKLWDVATGKELRTLAGHTDRVYSVAFSPDGKTLVSGSVDKTIKLWDVATGTLIRTLAGHTGGVYSVAFSPDGKTFASGSYREIKLWDVQAILSPNQLPVASFVFSPVSPVVGQWITFSAADSSDPDGTIASYAWSFGDGTTGSGVTVQKQYNTAGTFTVRLTVADNRGATGTTTRTVTVSQANQPPVASFVWEALSPEGGRLLVQPRTRDRIRFDASASRDPDGTITKYEWDWTSDETYDLTTTDPVTEYRFPTAGPHKVTLRVTDDNGATATTTQTVEIGEKGSPIADFTFAPTAPSILDVVQFTDRSTDPDGTVTSWRWEFGDGSTSTDCNPTHQYKQKGAFTVRLTVTDNEGLSSTTTKTLTVVNIPPDAVFTFTPKDPYAGQEITFDASPSQDKDGKITKYVWDFTGDGKPDREGMKVTWTFPQPGTYPVTLTVTDDNGVTATATQMLRIRERRPPVADFTFAPTAPSILDVVQFTDRSTDPDGTVTSWRWEFGDGSTSTDRNPTHQYKRKEAFTVKLTVTDNDGLTATVTKTLTVRNIPPEALFTFAPKDPYAGQEITFDASSSQDKDGKITKYVWDFTGDGKPDREGMKVTWIFPQPGTFSVTLTVTDDNGATATATQTLRIRERKPPVADFTFTPTSPSILDAVQFTDRSTDPDGTVTTWKWEFGDGNASTDRNPTHQYKRKEAFTVRLTVTDNDGLSSTTTKTLTVVNLLPKASFTFIPKAPYVGAEVAFDATGSQDNDGKITKYVWDFTGDGKPDQEGVEATWTFPQPGTFSVTLTVTDDDGATATTKDEIQVTLSPEPVEARRVWAVVVGVSAHREPRWNLRYARKDAEAFHRWLIETARVPKDQIQLLLDSQATLTEVRAGLEWLRRRADRDDLVIFFFAGHGYQGTDFSPPDEKDGLDEYFVLYDTKQEAIEATALRDEEFGQFLDRVLSKHVLVVFDSCHAAGGEREVRGLPRGARPVGDTVDIWGDFNLEGRIVLAAAKEDQESYEHPELGHGVFTHFLLQGLRGKADANNDGKVTVQELFTYVSREVPRYVREKVGAIQEPQMIGRGTPQVVLSKVNQPPTASFTFSPEAPFPGKVVQFTDISTDDGTITAWNWSFGDGATSTKQHPTHAYTEPGTYTVSLTVTDDGRLSATTTKMLIVGSAGEVTAVDLARGLVTISLGSKHGVRVGDRFEVVHVIGLPDGTRIIEVRGVVEVIHIASAERSVCRIVQVFFPIQVKDQVRPA